MPQYLIGNAILTDLITGKERLYGDGIYTETAATGGPAVAGVSPVTLTWTAPAITATYVAAFTADISPITLTWSAPSSLAGVVVTATIDETLPNPEVSGTVNVGSPPVDFGYHPTLVTPDVDHELDAVCVSGEHTGPMLFHEIARATAAVPVAAAPGASAAYGVYHNSGASAGLFISNGVQTYEIILF